MRLSSLQTNFKQGLFAVSHVAGRSVNLPILNNILLEAKEGKIRLAATNLEVGISCVVRGKIEKEGALTVDAKVISEYVGLLPEDKIDIEQGGNVLDLACGNYKTKINGQAADEFPLLPSVERKNPLKVGTEEFRRALSQIIFAAAAGESRLELSGVFFSFEGGNLVMAATDSYRLAEKTIKAEGDAANGAEPKRAIIPARTLQEVIRILSGSKEETGEITIYLSENQVLFVCSSVEIVSRLIEGQYPDYRQIIPTKAKTVAAVDTAALMRAVKAAAIFSKSGINDINLDFPKGKNKIIVSSASGQAGENVSEIEAKVSGDDNGTVINYRYLLDALNNIGEETVNIEIVDGNTPCLVKPNDDGGYLYIIMPIKQ